MQNYLENDALLKQPVKRAAFSDRTAYVMAEMSRLAYFKFEGGSDLGEIIRSAKEMVSDQGEFSKIEHLIRSEFTSNSKDEAFSLMANILKDKGFELVETFDDPGTGAQAFLCTQPKQKIAILAFRGTELSLKDIKADIKAELVEVEIGGKKFRIHKGYLSQFQAIQTEINAALKKDAIKVCQLFLTGHSLGGALAIVATKFLASDITGACYTFGSPPVGTKNFDSDIKTPIYRIVNHVDIVPRLPNPILIYFVRGLALLVETLLTPFTSLYGRLKSTAAYKKISRLLIDAQKYRQSGYDSYLVGEGKEVRLRYSVGVHDKLVWWFKQFKNILGADAKFLTDHSIDLYSRKLAVWAEKRK